MNEAATHGHPEATPEHDIRPVIATGSNSNLGLWAFLVVLAIGGAWLFTALSASRDEGETSSQFTSVEPSGGRIASPEPLRLPDRFSESGPVPRVVEEQTERLAPRILEPRVIPRFRRALRCHCQSPFRHSRAPSNPRHPRHKSFSRTVHRPLGVVPEI